MNYKLPILTFLLGVVITLFVMSFFIHKEDNGKITRWSLMTFTEKISVYQSWYKDSIISGTIDRIINIRYFAFLGLHAI